jgi:hypothetical protein
VRTMLRLAALLGTAYLLVATSRVPCAAGTPETQAFTVTGECGPEGAIAISSSDSCGFSVDGGRAVLLPETGSGPAVSPILGEAFTLSGWVALPDGGPVPLLDGGARLPGQLGTNLGCVACGPGNMFTCRGTPDDAGVVTLVCDRDGDSCTSTLTPTQ